MADCLDPAETEKFEAPLTEEQSNVNSREKAPAPIRAVPLARKFGLGKRYEINRLRHVAHIKELQASLTRRNKTIKLLRKRLREVNE